MRHNMTSPIVETYETWPLENRYRMRWGRDGEGQLWVSVEDEKGRCEGYLLYREYLQRKCELCPVDGHR